ncbi:MAG: YcxB family protein [Maritimibacter sp.]
MREILIDIDWTSFNRRKILSELLRAHLGKRRMWLEFGVVALVFLVSSAGVIWVQGNRYDPLAAYPVFFAIFATVWVLRRRALDMDKSALAAPFRQTPNTVRLTPEGVSAASFLVLGLRWDMITKVRERNDGVLLLLSPLEFVWLPDAGLPDDVDRAALLRQIEEWRR